MDTIHIRLLPLEPSDKAEVESRGCKPFLDLAMPPTRTFKQIQLYLLRKWTWLKELLLNPTSYRSLNIFYIDALDQRSSCLLKSYLNHSVQTVLQSALTLSNTVTLVYCFQSTNKASPVCFSDRLPFTISPVTERDHHPEAVSTNSTHLPDHLHSHPEVDQRLNDAVVEDSLMVALNSPSELALTMISPQDKGESRKRKLVSGVTANLYDQSPSPCRERHTPQSSTTKVRSPGLGKGRSEVKSLMNKEDSLFILLDDFLDTRCDVSHLEPSIPSSEQITSLKSSSQAPPLKINRKKAKKGKHKRSIAASGRTTTSVRTIESDSRSLASLQQQPRNPKKLRRIRPTFLAPLSAHDDFMATFKKLTAFSKL